MTQWYVKDLSTLTGVSVQTLHHYDRIDLLKPSVRLANGYRVYSEKDLLHLQQIIALKFFGFELSKIKTLLTGNAGALEHLTSQAHLLEQQANALLDASKALKGTISDVKDDQSIPWETIIKLIEVYRMTQNLEHPWVKDIFTPDELKQYVTFQAELKANTTPAQQSDWETNWFKLIAEIKDNLDNDPKSEIGIELGGKCMMLVNKLYGPKYAHLRTKKFEKGFGEGKGFEETGFTAETVAWLDKAIDAYWHARIYAILDQVGTAPSDSVLALWHEVMIDMYGTEILRKNELIDVALADDKISKAAKNWLKSLYNK